ncbi:MAG: hypothetical protein ACYCY8_13160 [Burkholderiales bacterium]
MRYWKVQVRPGKGDPFWCRAVEMTEEQVVLQSDLSLPAGTACNLRIVVPPVEAGCPPAIAGFSGDVDHAIFSSRGIQLSFRVKWLSDDARHLIGQTKAQRAGVGI